jgi:hypothetical protein
LVVRLNTQAEPRAIIAIEKAIEKTAVNKARVIEMLMQDRLDARSAEQFGASIKTAELIGIELGMFVKRTDNRHLVEQRFSDLPSEQQEAVAADLLERAREVIARAKVIEGEAEVVSEGSEPPEAQGG